MAKAKCRLGKWHLSYEFLSHNFSVFRAIRRPKWECIDEFIHSILIVS